MELTELTDHSVVEVETGVKTAVNKTSGVYNAPILYKVFAILEEIAGAQSELGINDIANKLNISKYTVYGITRTLKDLGAIRQDKLKKFKLGPALAQIGSRARDGVDLRLLARPVIEALSRTYAETIFLGVFYEHKITIIEKAESTSELRVTAPIGTSIPLFAGAVGKVFQSRFEESTLKNMLTNGVIPAFTRNSITDPGKYLKEIRQVRKLGYATDFEEYIQGVNAVSVPVTDWWGQIVALLWMVGFAHSLTREKMRMVAPVLMRAAGDIR